MKIFSRTLLFTFLFTMWITADAKVLKLTKQEIEQNTRLQIFLDNASFGPGKIDGKGGEFTKKALLLYNGSKGLESTSLPDLSSVDPVFTSYKISKEDGESVGLVPSGPAAQAKVKRLPYATLTEALAEKFHCDQRFLTQLNPPNVKFKEGAQITVPNVKPFELREVKTLAPGSEIAKVVGNDLGDETATKRSEVAAEGEKAPPSALKLHVSIKEEILKVEAGDKVVAAFPITVGSKQTESPVGHWTVRAVAKMPNFRYDLKMLNKGERSSHFHLLPPGPNNPVGVIWIALNKKGIGIHGTNDPDSIGRNASHGCIRLANWDIVKLAEMVKAGVAVVVE